MITFDYERCDGCGDCARACPFGAIVIREGRPEITAACKACKLCVKACPRAAVSRQAAVPSAAREPQEYSGVLVYVEHTDGRVAPLTYELIGKARELAGAVEEEVYCLFIGADIAEQAQELLNYGVDRVYTYDDGALRYFRADAYANAFEDCVLRCVPSAVLVGATNIGRSLAPRVAARLKTGLTADCTGLEMRRGGLLLQTRPAFGGNIMAQILTKHNRPQFATVRYRVMQAAAPFDAGGSVESVPVKEEWLHSGILLSDIRVKKVKPGIENASCLVVAGRGVQKPKDLDMLRELAGLLGGRLACSRPLVESGMLDYSCQIGLSGRSVRPRLMITCGVSGAVQFVAGMKGSETIFAINKDEKAPVMRLANYAAVGDLYEIVPRLIDRLKAAK